jgi:acyl-coenzyme A synthetase/AMP-(fatty) acid ligase
VVRGDDGLLRFVGRDDEMIKTAGNRVSPTEIEEAAVASGAAAEAVALGVPDERLGEAIMLVARAAIADADAVLRDYFKRQLPAFMQPRELIWRAELPRNANGKLDRAAIRAEMGR